jgi:hypothetical protein
MYNIRAVPIITRTRTVPVYSITAIFITVRALSETATAVPAQ